MGFLLARSVSQRAGSAPLQFYGGPLKARGHLSARLWRSRSPCVRAKHRTVLVVVVQPASIGALLLVVVRDMGSPVAYRPRLTMRRLTDLYPGEAVPNAEAAAPIVPSLAGNLTAVLDQRKLPAGRAEELLKNHPPFEGPDLGPKNWRQVGELDSLLDASAYQDLTSRG